MTDDVRERSKAILRTELAQAAADFCSDHGFERVTVDDIARGIGISRATFFRYFASKEDAVVAATRLERQTLVDTLRAEPIVPGSSAMAAIRIALEPTVDAARIDPARLRARIRMIRESPALRARLASDRVEERIAISAALRERIVDGDVAEAVAVASGAAIELGWTLWFDDADADLGNEFDRAFDLVAEAGTAQIAR